MLVRHGDASGARLPHEQEVALRPRGIKQAERLGKYLGGEKFDHIYSSDMARALKTAEIVARYHPHTPFTVREDIREVHSYNISSERNYGGRHLRKRLREERARAAHFARHIFRRHRPGERILVVAHGCLISLLIASLARLHPKKCPRFGAHNTSMTVLEVWRDRKPNIVAANCIAHLPSRLVS
jgi:broad specificity phosphatase PhoE